MTTTLPHFEPFAPDALVHPGGALAEGPLAHGSAGYTVLSFELATAVLRDSRFRNASLQLMEDFGIKEGPVRDFRADSVLMAEGPRHLRLRTPLARFMGPATVENIRDVLRGIIRDLAADLDPAAPVDFHGVIDRRLPARVYCYLAGAPVEDAPKVASLSERTLSLLNRDPSLIPDILEAYDELFAYLRELVARKRAQGLGEDMLSFLIGRHDAGKLNEKELFDEATAMLEASSVNTTHQAGLVVWTLLRNREIWQRLVEDHTLIPAAITEVLRLYPRPGVISRIATEDIDLNGTVIPTGSDVHVAVWSANRDPERFGSPAEFVLERENNQPLTFSTGGHNCLGQGLAKVEMEEVVRYLADHFPDAVVVEDGTEIGQAGGRWLVKSLSVDLRP
ncbi:MULTISPECIES: cytochrome P450 [unclassified Streptomyces]|uniref:cytochrome P450 n=1 Tax=unclassified Streptomyces TaxID=2593676 RepID=UPI00224E2026|nr:MULTISPECIES: cytochrome P450 [unclassified Streptomyces]MCX5435647.1 cytochrome P450 [Streptomyces sp. NBC_00063]WSE08821.1 cytochrome P450 [Streptomyces sp. NBC_01445]WSE13443.1 cytochrome P450 [Streptomyces sp. NBC_01397]WUB97641.1 cytochrome P450 [Streptomyces sp. NBC_00569]